MVVITNTNSNTNTMQILKLYVLCVGKHEWLSTIDFVFQSELNTIDIFDVWHKIWHNVMLCKRVDDINMWAKQMHNHCAAQDQGSDSFDSFETLQIYCTTKFLHQYYSRLCFRLLWIIARRFIYIPPPSLASFASSDQECSTWKKRKHNHPIVPKKWPSFTSSSIAP